MIEETVERLLPLLEPERIYTIADSALTAAIQRALPQLPEKNLLTEPQARNTAPCLMLATAAVFLENPEAVMAALPADHAIRDSSRFRRKLAAGAEAAASGERLITFGIPPSYPATGYGYIRFQLKDPRRMGGDPFFTVLEFKEKPDADTARRFCSSGDYYWNSGIFLWRAELFVRQIERFAPGLHAHWTPLLQALRERDAGRVADIYTRLPATSIDYALMEKSRGVWMGEGDFGWSDVGAWSALSQFWDTDEHGIAVRGESLALDSRNCTVYSPGKLTALIGVEDLIVVETEDALLICRRDQDQRVKELVSALRKAGRDEFL
jgi:mannose-1-phosphate guanylyltransferase